MFWVATFVQKRLQCFFVKHWSSSFTLDICYVVSREDPEETDDCALLRRRVFKDWYFGFPPGYIDWWLQIGYEHEKSLRCNDSSVLGKDEVASLNLAISSKDTPKFRLRSYFFLHSKTGDLIPCAKRRFKTEVVRLQCGKGALDREVSSNLAGGVRFEDINSSVRRTVARFFLKR